MFRNVIGVLLQHIDWPGTWRLHSKFVAQTHTGRKEEKSPWATEVGIVSQDFGTLAAACQISDASLVRLRKSSAISAQMISGTSPAHKQG